MKRFMAGAFAALMFWLSALPLARPDMIAPTPNPPERPPAYRSLHRQDGVPVYALAAGVVAVALTGSFIALRRIRKRRGSSNQ